MIAHLYFFWLFYLCPTFITWQNLISKGGTFLSLSTSYSPSASSSSSSAHKPFSLLSFLCAVNQIMASASNIQEGMLCGYTLTQRSFTFFLLDNLIILFSSSLYAFRTRWGINTTQWPKHSTKACWILWQEQWRRHLSLGNFPRFFFSFFFSILIKFFFFHKTFPGKII